MGSPTPDSQSRAGRLLAAVLISFTAGFVSSACAIENDLIDIQVGERDQLMRIALICESGCVVAQRSPAEFQIADVKSNFEIPLGDRSALAAGLTLTPNTGGAALKISTVRAIVGAAINQCVVGDKAASCIDLSFGPPPKAVAALAGSPGRARVNIAAVTAPSRKPLRRASSPTPPALRTSSSSLAAGTPPPSLRAAPNDDVLAFSRYQGAAPLAPAPLKSPEPAAPKLAVLQPVRLIEEGAPPADRAPRQPAALSPQIQPGLAGRPFDLREQASVILGKALDEVSCEDAQMQLNDNAWDLDAMGDVGFCRAVAGDLQEADALFIRLLAYTPDHYEALVGRALIAARAGEESVARRFFQDALNALPPIDESNRIVQVMNAL